MRKNITGKIGSFFCRANGASVLAGVGVFLLLILTSGPLPLSWDEGEYISRAESASEWIALGPGLFNEAAIEQTFPHTRSGEGHPCGFVLLISGGKELARYLVPFCEEKTKWRFGPICLTAIAFGAVFRRLSVDYSKVTALFAVLAMISIPRLFAHLHFASCDSSMTAAWLISWSLFSASGKSVRYSILCGCFLGLALASKFTAWAAFAPFALGLISLFRTPKEFWRTAVVFPAAILTFYLLDPPLWYEPVHGFMQFTYQNTHRESFDVSILFLGEMYDLGRSLPWYNTLFWTGITVPLGILFLTVIGIYLKIRNPGAAGLFLLANAAILLIARAFPGTPPHDGVRLFISAFPFLGILAGIAAGKIWMSNPVLRNRISVVLLLLSGTANLAIFAPQWLSYYNILIGGLPGAVEAGMEPTYYWDGLDSEVLEWVDRNTFPDEEVRFSPHSRKNLEKMRQWNELTRDFQDDPGGTHGKIRWYVMQRRPSGEMAVDVELIATAEPVYKKTIRRNGFGPWDLSEVPLIEIYRYEDFEKAGRAVEDRTKI